MRIKYISLVVVLLALGFGVGRLSAGSGTLDSPGPPEATSSYSLEDIYNRLDTGAAGSQSTFTEPTSGPGTGTGHTLNELMAKAPVADNTNGATKTDVVNGKTFWGLNTASGQWGLQTGTASISGNPAPVPKTGQTVSYASGDDGDLEKGVAWPPPRFTDNGNGTVTDNLTGLIWLKYANCFGTRTWRQALSDANGLTSGHCGLMDGSTAGDWRLPNVRELSSLTDFSRDFPALPRGHPFTGVRSNRYWSSTRRTDTTSYAWYVGMFDGRVHRADKTYAYFVWPVRGGQ